jgi:hypothetical protein
MNHTTTTETAENLLHRDCMQVAQEELIRFVSARCMAAQQWMTLRTLTVVRYEAVTFGVYFKDPSRHPLVAFLTVTVTVAVSV